ncbi:mechanosensitive ion channel family protein [Agrobacterium tumefaciens]|uniref:mechanosensitive ion channel family protein n=1 Tax=Agrobacterium tumefaciens TaxID=358 RepID=UPI00287ED975|nr:mechanosensitive ion channel family protein [Agrobacterium tumefaciens]MDS7594315.1 mechanosensitive ion channel family protein [Agrobacterium tumefaciens]
MKRLLLSLFLLISVLPAGAQPAAPPTEKIEALTRLLQDPEIQAWIRRADDVAKTAPAPDDLTGTTISTWEAAVRDRLSQIVSSVPRIPTEVAGAVRRVRAEATSSVYAPVLMIFTGLVLVGMFAERLYLTLRAVPNDGVSRIVSVLIFAFAMAALFLAIDWPPLVRTVLLIYLIAFVAFRFVSSFLAISDIREGVMKWRFFAGIAIFAIANAVAGPLIGIDRGVVDALSYLSSLVLLAFLLVMIWSVRAQSVRRRLMLTIAVVFVWSLWSFGFKGLFWLGVYSLILPATLRAVGRSALLIAPDAKGIRSVLLVRGARAIVIALALGWLAVVWQMNPEGLAQRDPLLSAFFYGLLKSVVVVLIADLLWHMAKSWIDSMLVTEGNEGLTPQDIARRSRLRTLLPIVRNGLAAVGLTITALLVLAELGVEIGPLIAGAGVFGVAIGFGSQTLVKDVISGVFYMLDDAFRVGEYIQAKNYKGTVEGFSLRSVRLRHHRGPIFTVPFGELGAVENMSRDWGVVKFRISVGFDTDVEKARKLTKKIGATMLEDPEFGPLFIEPLKMKGVEEFGDYGMVLSFGMTLKPSPMQSFIRRRANLLLREAFIANGIQFAQPMVNVGGENAGGGTTAAALQTITRAHAMAAPETGGA